MIEINFKLVYAANIRNKFDIDMRTMELIQMPMENQSD